jgi:hypothetical protein
MKRLSMHRLAGIASAAALAGTLTFVGLGSTSAGASVGLGLLPTTTQVGLSPFDSYVDGVPAAIFATATITELNVDLLGTDSVTFDVYNPSSVLTLTKTGNVNCELLSDSCQVTAQLVQTDDAPLNLTPGTWTVIAHYSGNLLSQASVGTTTFLVKAGV